MAGELPRPPGAEPGHESVTLQEHRQILGEIAAGNEEGAAAEMRAHLNRSSALYRVPPAGRIKDLGRA